MKYRKKPVVIEATQWFKNGDHPADYTDKEELENGILRVFTGAERKEKGWEGCVVRYYRRPDDNGLRACGADAVNEAIRVPGAGCGHLMHDHGWIDTPEGGHIVCPGDFIITGVKGEVYPCKPDIFAATYEEVKE